MATFGVKVVVTRFGVFGLFGIEVWQVGLGVYWVWGTLTQPKTPDIIKNITLLLEVRGAAPDRM